MTTAMQGRLDIWEVREFMDNMGTPLSDNEIEEVFSKLDTNEDGFITSHDFVRLLC